MQKLKYYGSVILFFIVVGALGFGTSYVQRPHNVVIGVNLALSGEEKAYGEATARGIGMARDKINAEGGLLDEAVTVVAVDNHGSAGDAEAAVNSSKSRRIVATLTPKRRAVSSLRSTSPRRSNASILTIRSRFMENDYNAKKKICNPENARTIIFFARLNDF